MLPRPKFNHGRGGQAQSGLDFAWMREDHNLDKLLTLSCNIKGMRSLLSSVFYEPGITCNVVSPWLQGTYAVLNSVKDTRILAHMLMSRIPHLAFFWLGGIIVDMHKIILKESQFGLIFTDLHAATWTGTMQSFMQEPILPAVSGSTRRADECRILFLVQEERHTRWPVCQWAPFGVTALEDAEIEVRSHANCAGHGLQYAGWSWTCYNGKVVHQVSEPALAPFPQEVPVMPNIAVNYEALNHNEESASENATRNIFSWLRVEGYPPAEKRIHEWIAIDDSNEDELSEDNYSAQDKKLQGLI